MAPTPGCPERYLARLLDYTGHCTSIEEFRTLVLSDLRQWAGSDGGLLRPGCRWSGSQALYLDEGPRFTDLYVANADRFRPELTRWCALSLTGRAFVDDDVYPTRERDRMSIYGEVIRPDGIRSILACPLALGDDVVGLIFLFRRGRAVRRFPEESAAIATRLLPALSLAERFLATAFAHGRPVRAAGAVSPTGAAFDRLPPRERQVAALLARGLQGKEIAALLDVSPHTVHVLTARLYDKLGLHNRTQVALLVQQLGVVRPGALPGADPAVASFADLLRRVLAHRFGEPWSGERAVDREEDRAGDRAASRGRLATLGARERQVAGLIARGLTSAAIARLLGTSVHTVRRQTQHIFHKLGVRGRTRVAAEVLASRNDTSAPGAADL